MMNGSTAFWSKASYRQHQQEVGHDMPGLAAQEEHYPTGETAARSRASLLNGAGEVFADTQLDEAF